MRLGLRLALIAALSIANAWLARDFHDGKRVAVVVPGRLIRGAWQRPETLGRIIKRDRIRTVVTLTAINRDDPKYMTQAEVVRRLGVAWIIVPMRGSTATLDQLAEAADLLADPDRQPVFFHCIAGHHRTSLVHAAYRIRQQGWSADRAWREVVSLPWSRPGRDLDDRRVIEAFAARCRRSFVPRKEARVAAFPNPEGRLDPRRGSGPFGPADRHSLVVR